MKKPRERIGCVEQVDDVAFLHVGVVTTNGEKQWYAKYFPHLRT